MLAPALTRRRLMAIEAVHAALRVHADLVFVHDRILLLRVALGALAGGAYEFRRRLSRFDARPRAVDEERADDQPECNHDRDEDGPERHTGILRDHGAQ